MSEPTTGYREDDLRGVGYCPKCGRALSGMTLEPKGFCDLHGWVFANFEQRLPDEEDE